MTTDFNLQLKKIIKKISQKYKPEKIILFGSAASGKTRKWSDADLVVIKKTNKKFHNRIEEVSSLVKHEIPLDFLVYTPKEFKKMSTWNYFIKKEVIEKGKIVYES